MNRKQLIEKLKKNEKAYCFLSNEERNILKELNPSNLTLLNKETEFVDIFQFFEIECNVYRIKEDYVESRLLECEVVSEHNRLYFIRNNNRIKLNQAVNYTDFVCYKFNGVKGSHCRLHIELDEIAAIPTHVIFKP